MIKGRRQRKYKKNLKGYNKNVVVYKVKSIQKVNIVYFNYSN